MVLVLVVLGERDVLHSQLIPPHSINCEVESISTSIVSGEGEPQSVASHVGLTDRSHLESTQGPEPVRSHTLIVVLANKDVTAE